MCGRVILGGSGWVLSLAEAGVDEDGDGAVVGEGDFHVGSEDAACDGFSEFGFEGGAEGLVEGFGDGRRGGGEERRTVSFAGGGVEGELADDDDIALDFLDGAVHFAFVIGEDAHAGDFRDEPGEVIRGVAFLDAEEDEESGAGLGDGFRIDGDGGVEDALEDGSHGGF